MTVVVPGGLDEYTVRLAIARAASNQELPDELTKGQEITDNALQALLPSYRSAKPIPQGGWFLESAVKNRVIAGFQQNEHYLQVAIDFDAEQARMTILRTEKVRFDGVKVHKVAVYWMRDLRTRIRRELSKAAVPAP